jgi:xanthine dehydrogenase YagR molybdenum-binding subunit
MLVGYGMGTGIFGASRWNASVKARLSADGTLLLQSAVSDSGPGTATAMTRLAADSFGLPTGNITFELGNSSLPPGPTQGGSTTTSTLGSAVHEACNALKQKLVDLAKNNSVFHTENIHTINAEDLVFEDGEVILAADRSRKIAYTDLLKQNNTPQLEVTIDSKGAEQQQYSMYSFSVHFAKVHVHPKTGIVRVVQVATVADSGKIVSEKTASSQMIGGVVGGIGMALTEEAVIDNRFGRFVTKDFADYHVPVHADIPHIDTLFVNKPDPIVNPIGAKGMGEIALIGFAAAVANAVFHATGKRVRDLPITPDKLI